MRLIAKLQLHDMPADGAVFSCRYRAGIYAYAAAEHTGRQFDRRFPRGQFLHPGGAATTGRVKDAEDGCLGLRGLHSQRRAGSGHRIGRYLYREHRSHALFRCTGSEVELQSLFCGGLI